VRAAVGDLLEVAVEVAPRLGGGIDRVAAGDDVGVGELAELLLGLTAPPVDAAARRVGAGDLLGLLGCFGLVLFVTFTPRPVVGRAVE
jgi:hypothetical protein